MTAHPDPTSPAARTDVPALVAELELLRAAAQQVVGAHGKVCNVCIGISPARDGHDKNPPCERAAMDELALVLATEPVSS